jgi:hypothetical protein
MGDDAYIGRLLAGVAGAFTPLAEALASPASLCALLSSLGWSFDPASGTSEVSVLGRLATSLETLDTDVTTLAAALAQAGDPETVAAAIAQALPGAIQGVGAVINEIQALSASAPDPGWPPPLSHADFWAAFPGELLDLLIYRQLSAAAPQALALLRALGIFMIEAPVASASRPAPIPIPVAHWERLATVLSAPLPTLRSVFFTVERSALGSLLDALGGAATALGVPAAVLPPDAVIPGSPPVPAQANLGDNDGILAVPLWSEIVSTPAGQASAYLALVIAPIAGTAGQPPAGVLAYPVAAGTLSAGPFSFSDQIGLTLTGSLTSDQAITIALTSAGLTLTTSLSGTDLSGGIRLDVNSGPQPWVVFGSPDSSNLTLSKLHAAISAGGSVTDPTFSVEFGIDAGSLILSLADADGFLRTVLGDGQHAVSLATTLNWAPSTGLTLSGSPGLQASIPAHLDLAGVLSIDAVGIALGGHGPTATLTVTISGSLSLGPLEVSAQGLGLQGSLTPAAKGSPGNLGPLDLNLGFQPPSGLALALNAAPVSGVGFIAFDEAAARYLGALALAVGDVSISAVGVLDTRLPGGTRGYSLVVVAAATFPPVQLGFGFALDGIGGLLGVNRTVNVPSLQATARAGHLDDLMFPAELADRAPQVAASLAAEFPTALGHFIIGPAVQLQWGTDGLLDAEVGVFIELSDAGGGISLLRVALLGWVHLTLPEAAAPVADLTLDVLGVMDLAAKTLSLDAGLRNSSVAGFPLTGQAALRAGWGSNPEFVFAVGGFNPHFAAPAGFPALQRVTMAIAGDSAQLTLSSYLALTSNTLQFGCAASLNATAGPAAVNASLTFDALIQFRPFGLIIDLTITATVLLDGNAIMSLGLDLHLKGPQPWTVTGQASFHVLFCSFSVPIAITVGPQPPPASPVPVDLSANLTTALSDPRSWQTSPPAGQGMVKVRALDAARPAVHPLGSLTVRQHAVPLQQRVERYGPDLLQAPCQYQITGAALGGQAVPQADVTDFFAPAQFITMTDAQKLSAPSFESMSSGVTLGSTALTVPLTPSTAGTATVADTSSTAQWDMLVLDSPDPAAAAAPSPALLPPAPTPPAMPAPPVTPPAALLAAQLSGAAAAVNGPGGHGSAVYTSPGSGSQITVQQPTYAVTGMNLAHPLMADLTLVPPGAVDLFRMPTAAAAASAVVADVSGRESQVVYHSEVAGTWAT